MQAILAADDDPTACAILREALGAVPGWTVTTVANGADLLEALATVVPSLVLLDVDMPGLGGIETYRYLREREATALLPVLFITGSPQDVEAAGLPGPHDCLEKPFSLDDLLARVAHLLGEPTPDL